MIWIVFLFCVARALPSEGAWRTNIQLSHKEIRAHCKLPFLFAKDFLDEGGRPSPKKLKQKLMTLKTAVFIEGMLDNWVALKKWQNQDYFMEQFGDVQLPRNLLHKNNPNSPVRRALSGSTETTNLRDFVMGWEKKDIILFQLTSPEKSLLGSFSRDLRNETGTCRMEATPALLTDMQFEDKVFSMGPTAEVCVSVV